MQYEPIKTSVGKFFSGAPFMRKLLYALLDLLLLRTWHVKKSLVAISHHLPDNASVLDAGSGFGQYTWRMSRMNRHWRIKALDLNSKHIEECKTFFTRCRLSDRVSFEVADLTALNHSNQYDLILSVDVMEHIEDDRLVFSNFYRALNDKGFLLISTPSDKGGSDVHHEDEESFIDEHVRDGYSVEDIKAKLTEAGFTSVETRYSYGKPGTLSWRLSMKYPVKMVNASGLFFAILPLWYIIVYPLAFVLNYFDVALKHPSGTGLIVTARKTAG